MVEERNETVRPRRSSKESGAWTFGSQEPDSREQRSRELDHSGSRELHKLETLESGDKENNLL